MPTEFTRTSMRLAAAIVIAGGLAACSTIESLDPTGLLGGGNDTGGLSDAGAAASEDADTAQPDVASVPDRPETPSSDSENAATVGSLQADAANVQYSAEDLRGGTEAPGAPPAGDQVAEAQTESAPSNAASSGEQQAPGQPEAAPPPSDDRPLTDAPSQPAPAPPPAPADTSDVAAIPAEPEPTAQPESEAAPEAQPEAAPAREVASAPETPAEPAKQQAAPEPTPSSAPVEVASAGPAPGAQAPVTRRAAPGFEPSKAPPLDPTVTQFVPAPVVARYKQTAMLKPSVFPAYTPGAFGPVTATVIFPGDTTILDEKAQQQVRAAAELYKSHGGQGYVRIVGFASASSGNLPPARLKQINFDRSQARATAVARALMKEGVPADKVLVSAAPQTATVAKAEIYVQG